MNSPIIQRGIMAQRDIQATVQQHVRRMMESLEVSRELADVRERHRAYGEAGQECVVAVCKIIERGFDETDQAYNLHRASSERLLAEYLDRALKAERRVAELETKT